MGTVHGVYLKYVGLSAISYAGYTFFMDHQEDAIRESESPLRALLSNGDTTKIATAMCLAYSTVLNGIVAALFKMEWGMGLIGKDPKTGSIPIWSYVIFAPFHIPTKLYTHVHTLHSTYKVPSSKEGEPDRREVVPVASLVQPGWWVGGCYADQLNKKWTCVIDLTVEFPETCIEHTQAYLSVPTWDGVPASPEQLEYAANFAVEARRKYGGDVLVHCAHGRGRSTTVMCACLVKEGLFPNWEEAFEKGIKPGRSVCKLNRRMQQNLTKWQATYVDKEDDRKGK